MLSWEKELGVTALWSKSWPRMADIHENPQRGWRKNWLFNVADSANFFSRSKKPRADFSATFPTPQTDAYSLISKDKRVTDRSYHVANITCLKTIIGKFPSESGLKGKLFYLKYLHLLHVENHTIYNYLLVLAARELMTSRIIFPFLPLLFWFCLL